MGKAPKRHLKAWHSDSSPDTHPTTTWSSIALIRAARRTVSRGYARGARGPARPPERGKQTGHDSRVSSRNDLERSLCEQICTMEPRRRPVKKGVSFCLMVVGASGTGM